MWKTNYSKGMLHQIQEHTDKNKYFLDPLTKEKFLEIVLNITQSFNSKEFVILAGYRTAILFDWSMMGIDHKFLPRKFWYDIPKKCSNLIIFSLFKKHGPFKVVFDSQNTEFNYSVRYNTVILGQANSIEKCMVIIKESGLFYQVG